MQTKVYEQVQRQTAEGPELEASVLFRGALKLKQCARNWENRKCGNKDTREFTDTLTDALQYNQRLWSYLQADLANPANRLPETLRLNLIQLSSFVDKRIFALFAGGGTVDDLLSIARVNEQIAEGLRRGSASCAEQEESASPSKQLLDIAG
jgi:flagellar biosynthesis activator protein FlaF